MAWSASDDFEMNQLLQSLDSPREIRELTPEEILAGRQRYRLEVLDMMGRLGEDTENEALIESYIADPTSLITRYGEFFTEMSRQRTEHILFETLTNIREGAKYQASLRSARGEKE